jgi:hypothetical protein
MGYTILYKSFGIEFPNNQHLLFSEIGSSNLYDTYTNKRCRSWETLNISKSILVSSEDILNYVDGLVGYSFDRKYNTDNVSIQDIKKRLGYYTAISIYGSSTHSTTYSAMLNFLNKAVTTQSIKIEDYFGKGYKLTFKTSNYNIKNKESYDKKFDYNYASTIEEFFNLKLEYDNLVKEDILSNYSIDANYYFFENLIAINKINNRANRQPKPKKELDNGYYIKYASGYFVKVTQRKTYYSYDVLHCTKFKTFKEAKKKLDILKNRSSIHDSFIYQFERKIEDRNLESLNFVKI